ncbi:glycoside hydrolase domain-containing protein [Microbacterium sp. MYb62]|uniref:glycoside hydrolase domain-containing protein n=1 Tax=Microbacterium sp. MYb62 TaxID=1848690 RepID=UPI0015E37D55|nr:glycoside hydrolase domain-containing protein [Microbacterium sp. MYb62]
MTSDPKVRATQEWLNATYGTAVLGRKLDEDGQIGWKTIFGMIRGLQKELGITSFSDSFGDGTMAALTAQHPVISSATSKYEVRRLAQSALWCHGYLGGHEWGTLDAVTNNGIKGFLVSCGLASAAESVPTQVTPKMLKALMTLDAYSLVGSGTASIREAQQWINGKYRNRKLPILPCDGIFTRSTQQGLMTAIQYELLLTDSQANGNFGPSTKSGLAAQGNVSSGSVDGTRNWVRLFQCALRFNGYDSPLTGTFNAATVSTTNAFQSYAELGATGAANFKTWASLLISTGDETRAGTASDMASQLTASWCNSLYTNGYRTVGRYLSVLGKRYAPGELENIFNAGLKTFPIMQESNTGPNDFSYEKGLDHGFQALRRLRQLGFKDGTTVFFAVDFDALDDTITSLVKPYFEGINQRFNVSLSNYRIGIYGTRNVCARIINDGLAQEAFIASMSWGWGGNLGFPLPPSWSYDQIWNGVLSGTTLEIDKNIQSSRAKPAARADVARTPLTYATSGPGGPPTTLSFDEDYFWYISELTTRAEIQAQSKESAWKIALFYLQNLDYTSAAWQAVAPADLGSLDFLLYQNVRDEMPLPPVSTRSRMTHWAASTRVYQKYWILGEPAGSTATVSDLGAWGLDLAQAWGDYLNASTSEPIRSWIASRVGSTAPGFDHDDMLGDIDALLVTRMLRDNPNRSLDDTVREIEVNAVDDPLWRYRRFMNVRFGNSYTAAAEAGRSVFTTLWGQLASWAIVKVAKPTTPEAHQVGLGFSDALRRLADQ